MKNTQKNKGLTLIALVITIIVLIVLMSVAINVLFGNNGIITKTKLAKSKFLGQNAREEIERRVTAYKQDAAQKGVDPTLYDFWFMYNGNLDSGYFTDDMAIYLFEDTIAAKFKPKIKSDNRPEDSIANIDAGYSRENPYETAIVVYDDYIVVMDDNMDIEIPAAEIDISPNAKEYLESTEVVNGGNIDEDFKNLMQSLILDNAYTNNSTDSNTENSSNSEQNTNNNEQTSSNNEQNNNESGSNTFQVDSYISLGSPNSTYTLHYGKIVTGYNSPSNSTWRLFYADSNYAYLMYTNYIPETRLSDLSGFEDSQYSRLMDLLNPKYASKFSWSNCNCHKAIAVLLDPNNWTNYCDNDVALWAIGAPTIDLYAKSYNATHYGSSISNSFNVYNGRILYDAKNGGYMVGRNDGSLDTTCANGTGKLLFSKSDLDKNIYDPGKGKSLWLASPSAQDGNSLLEVYRSSQSYDGITTSPYNTNAFIKPIVCVPISKISINNNQLSIVE